MSFRSFIAVLLLLNYLLVVGVGCVNRPEDQRELVMVQTIEAGQHYQQCRYLRMDGLEAFLADALANQYKEASDAAPQHLFFVVNGVDAHYLLPLEWTQGEPGTYRIKSPPVAYVATAAIGMDRDLYTPPWLG